jgi:signal transduction histidine kinase
MRLTMKLMLFFLLLTTIPLAVVGYLAYDNGRRTIEQNTINHLISTNTLKEAEFDRWVRDHERLLRALTRCPLVQEYTAVLVSRDSADPEYQAAYASLVEDHLIPTLEEGGFLDLFILRGGDGLILVSTEKSLEGKYREGESFSEGRDHTYTGNARYSLSLGEVVMHISTPIQDREGSLIAVLSGHAALAEISEIMEQHSGLSGSEDTYLVNSFNFLVTEPRFGKGYALEKAIHTEGVEACLQQGDGVGFYEDDRGVAVIGAYHWIPERELCILTEVGQAEAFAPVIALRDAVVGIGSVVALIVALLGLFFARTITDPVHQLVTGAAEIGQGNLEHRIDVRGRDEISQLATAFNDMAASLQATTASRDELNKEITERKRAEEALKEYSEQLEEMVNERTKELQEAQERLIRQESLAVLGQLASGVGHELRNPLGVIKNAVYFLNMVVEEPDPEVEEILEILQQEVATSEEIISSLLDFARAKLPARRVVDVNNIVQEALSRVAVPENVEVVSQLDKSLPSILADPDQLDRVFGNIVLNGIQAMPEGGRLVIETSEVSGKPLDSSWAVISFADTGVGILEENLGKIFEPLFTTKAKGIGLGLALVKTLVEGHGGSVEVESEVGKGSTFTVRLPAPE